MRNTSLISQPLNQRLQLLLPVEALQAKALVRGAGAISPCQSRNLKSPQSLRN